MKNIFTYSSKIKYGRILKSILLLLCFFSFLKISNAQTVNLNLISPPCKNNGVIVAQSTGITPPIIFDWYNGRQTFIDTVNSANDTLSKYSGGYIYAYAYGLNGKGNVFGTFTSSLPFTYSTSSTPAVCPALGSVEVKNITGGTAPYTVQWFLNGGSVVIATGDSVNLPSGSYSVLITDGAGCIFGSYASNDSLFIYNISPITYTAGTTPANCTNGTASLTNVTGGIVPYGYVWSNGSNSSSISGLIMGNYSVTVTDAQGCSTLDNYIYVQQSVSITANPTTTSATCLQTDGSAIVFGGGGVPPYTYLWSNGQQTQSITGLAGGFYDVTATDSHGCIGYGQGVYVGTSTPISVTYSATPSSCTAATGSATLSITGGTSPYTINWDTYPTAQTGTTASNLPQGLYTFKVTDAVGCVQSGQAYIPPISVISAYPGATDAVCKSANGTASVFVITGSAPYTYTWSNGGNTSSINGLAAGYYTCTITDNMSCSITKYAVVNTSTPIGIILNDIQASCIYSSDGQITATPYGGSVPYTYSWSNGSTTSTATGLSAGYNYVYVSDAAGCTQNAWTYLSYDPSNNSCYCTISGTVYDDLNNNCVQDAGEPGIQNIMIHCDGFGYTFTDANGNYSFQVPSGSYTLSESVQYYYPLASCQSNSIAVNATASSGCTHTVNFANVINPIHDVKISTCSFYSSPIAGYNYLQKVIVENDGTIDETNVQVGYKHDALVLNNFVPGLFTQQSANWYNITSGFALTPGQYQAFDVNYYVPSNVPLGTVVNYFDTTAHDTSISKWLTDYTPWNNVNAYQNSVVGSFDPNFKEVNPIGTGTPGFITTSDSVLTYTIHFQNTGNYPAQKVIVIDTLNTNLDITTLHPGYSNHTFTTTVDEKGVLKFTFNNINLPDSGYNKAASSGLVMYTIRQKPKLANGTQIKSPANIYFDYNAPVKTNIALNTINSADGIPNYKKPVFDLTLYPNPTNGSVTILVNTDQSSSSATLKFYNILGKQMQAKTISLTQGKNVLSADVSALPEGLYFVEITEGSKTLVQKLSLIK